jgi:exonuclease III
MYYHKLKSLFKDEHRNAVIDNLCKLKEQLSQEVPDKDIDHNLLLATWNIRDFGKLNRRGYGDRIPESHFYIAEILSAFDLIAVQEVNELDELQLVMSLLGNQYDYIATDVADPAAGGNGERMTFIYDKRKIWFKNIAGEIVLPAKLLISKTEFKTENGTVVAGKQFHRTPFVVSFQCGWFKFDLCTVHLFYGEDSGNKLKERIEEIGSIANYLSKRADEAFKQGKSLILLGDFNIISPEHETMRALLNSGFVVPKVLRQKSNVIGTKYYDQIAFKTSPDQLEYIEKGSPNLKNRNAGLFNIFKSVFRDEQSEYYFAIAAQSPNGKNKSDEEEKVQYYRDWRTYQMSDHNLMWVRLKVNDSLTYLDSCRIKGGN